MLLKSAEFEEKTQKREIFNLRDVAEEAREMIATAKRESERLLDQAQQEKEKLFEQAQQEGHQTGYGQGLAEGGKKGLEQALAEARDNFAKMNDQTLNALKSVLQQFNQEKENILWRSEQETVQLALAIAEKVIKQTPNENSRITSDNVMTALKLVARNTHATVWVNPEDQQNLEKMAGKNETVFGKFENINFVTDEEITPGGCRVTTENGQIDAQLETQIKRIADELLMTDTPKND